MSINKASYQTLSGDKGLKIDVNNYMSTQDKQSVMMGKSKLNSQRSDYKERPKVDMRDMVNKLDDQRKFTIDDLEKFESAKDNMKNYMESYSQVFNLPSLYVQNQLFYKPVPRYIIQIVQYVYPDKKEEVKVFQHYLDGRSFMTEFDDIYNSNYGAFLKLVRVDHGELHTEAELQISKTAKKIGLAFSEKYDQLAISYVEEDKTCIRVLSCQKEELTSPTKKDCAQNFMENYRKNNYVLSLDLPMSYNYIENLIFDRNGKYLVGYGDTDICVMDLFNENDHKDKNKDLHKRIKKQYKIQKDYFEKIYHLRYESLDDGQPDICFVACKKQNMKQILLFNINQEDIFAKFQHDCESSEDEAAEAQSASLTREQYINKNIQILTFFKERSEHLKIMISQDCQKVVFCNADENFLIEKINGSTLQKNLPNLRGKIIRFISCTDDGKEFYFVACHDYDTCLEIQSTSDYNFKFTIPRSVEPGIIKIFDIDIKAEKADGQLQTIDSKRKFDECTHITLLSLRDDDTVYDRMKYTIKPELENPMSDVAVDSKQCDQIIQMNMKAYSFQWPYVCFSGLKNNFLFILSVYDNKIIHRVQLKEDCENHEKSNHFRVLATCITLTNDLFVLTQETNSFSTQDKVETYKVFHLDLDESNQLEHTKDVDHWFKQDIVLEYTNKDVNGQAFKSFHCRGSSAKEKIDTNHKLMIFLHHGDELYSCVQLQHNREDALTITDRNLNLKFLSKISSKRFYFINDSRFLFLETVYDPIIKTKVVEQNIKQVDVYFRYNQCETILKESSVKEEIIAFNIDQDTLRIFLLAESHNDNSSSIDSKIFKIYCLKKRSFIFEVKINDEPLIQRLKSGLYTLIEGHIYFNNNVIKLRYDRMSKKDSHILLEDEVFDFYYGIFQLKPGERVKSGTPLDSMRGHKMAYVTSDKVNFSTSMVRYTPYLHEKKLYLNRPKTNTDYFYTSITTKLLPGPKDEPKKCSHGHEMKLLMTPKKPHSRKEYTTSEEPNLVCDKCKKDITRKEIDAVGFYNCYIMYGKRKHEKDYHKKCVDDKYLTCAIAMNLTERKMYAYSQNGILLARDVFKKEVIKYGDPLRTSADGQNFIFKKSMAQRRETSKKSESAEAWIYNVMTISMFGLRFIKEINIKEQFKRLNGEDENWFSKWLSNSEIKNKKDTSEQEIPKLKFQIADNLDTIVQITDSHKKIGHGQNPVIYLFIAKGECLKTEDLKKQMDERQICEQERFYFKPFIEELEKSNRKSFIYIHDLNDDHWQKNLSFNPHGTHDQTWKFPWTSGGSHGHNHKTAPSSATDNQVQDAKSLLDLQISQEMGISVDEHRMIHQKKSNLDNWKFIINTGYLIYYNQNTIHYYDLREEFNKKDLKTIELEIGEEENYSKVKGIYCSSNAQEIVIIIDNTIEEDLLILWDMKNNTETNSFDVGKQYQIYFDSCGEVIVATQHHCIKDGSIIKAFNIDETMYKTDVQIKAERGEIVTNDFGLYHGHRFDHNNHNWVINKKYMALPFSYMSFVIKNAIETNDKQAKQVLFDIEPYNYIFNRSTSFLDSKFVTNNHLILEKVLKNCWDIEPDIIESLAYAQTYVNKEAKLEQQEFYPTLSIAPLSKAVKSDNNRCVGILLEYMSNINHDFSTSIQDLFPLLIDQSTFQQYLTKMSVQTAQMREKQFITVGHPSSRDYVRMSVSKSLYVDDHWFSKNMGEDKDRIHGKAKNYPVEMRAMKIRWFILSQYGNEFLQEVLNNENLELYNIPTLRIIIEFFYGKYKIYLFKYYLPIYAFKVLIFFVTVYLNEKLRTHKDAELDNSVELKEHFFLIQFFLLMQAFAQFVQVWIIYQSYKHFGFVKFFQKVGSYLQIAMVILFDLNIIFVFKSLGFVNDPTLTKGDLERWTVGERYVEVCLTFLLIQRFFQFLELYDETSPLMDIIYQIFSEIKWFAMVFAVVIGGISCCFFLIGQLQLDFDGLTADEKDQIVYRTLGGAVWYIWYLVLGQPDDSMYDLGDGNQFIILRILFSFAAFFLIIHMLNMLIAIMGNTYSTRSAIASQTRMKDHLKFIIQNWHLGNKAFGEEDKKSIKYIITAFAQDTSRESHDVHEIVQEESAQLLGAIRESSLNAHIKQNQLELKVLSLSHAITKLTNMVQKQGDVVDLDMSARHSELNNTGKSPFKNNKSLENSNLKQNQAKMQSQRSFKPGMSIGFEEIVKE